MAAFLAATSMLSAAVVYLLVQVQGVGRVQGLLTEGYLPLSLIVDQIRGDQRRVDTDIDRLLREQRRPVTGAQSAAALYGERLRENLLSAQSQAERALDMARDAQEVAVLKKTLRHLVEIETLIKNYQLRTTEFVERSEAGDREAAAALVKAVEQDAFSLGEEIDKVDLLIEGRIHRLTSEIDALRTRATTIAGALTASALLMSIGLLGAVLVALRPIGTLTDHVQRLAAGQRPARLDVRGDDEVALLSREFDRMVEAIELRDRTLTERAEQLDRLSRYLASVLDSLEDALFVVENNSVTLANPAALARWGVATGGAPPKRVESWLEAVGVHEDKEGASEFDVRVVPFGSSGSIVVAADVTEQRRALERLARSERLALIGEMLAQITHEVRNPLNAMSLNAEMLADEIERVDPDHKSDARELLATVSGEIDRLTRVTGHYLQLARRPRATLEPHNLAGLVREVARLLQAELDQSEVTLTVTTEDLPRQLVDGNQLRQALLNIVRNAVEAGATKLTLSVQAMDGLVQLALADNGEGMSSTEAERALDPFYSTKATGTGLGLAITRQILEDHHGTIEVTSTPGQGTEVALWLPDRPAPNGADLP